MENKLYLNLSGGMNRKATPLITKDEECELLVNFHLDKVGGITKRKGYSKYLDQPEAGKDINGIFQHNRQAANDETQIMVANNAADTNGVIYYRSSSSWTAAKTDDTADKKTYFSSFIDYVFRTNGADVVASSADGVTWGTTNAPSTITPKYTEVFQDRVYVANGASSNRSRLWFSSLPSSGSITWDTANDWVDVNPDDGDQITALENNGNRLLIFKNRAVYRWSFGQVEPDRLIGVGTSSQASVKTNFDIGITFFANPNGVYAYTGSRPKLLSRKIQDIIDGVSDWNDVYAEVDNDHYYLSVGDVSIDGRTFNNVVLVYTISLEAWSIYQLATPVTFMGRLDPDNDGGDIYFGSNDGRTYLFLDGTSDDGSDIDARFRSKEYMLSFPSLSFMERVDVFAPVRGTTHVLMDIDREDNPVDIGMLQNRITDLRLSDRRRMNSVRIYLYDTSTNDAQIEGFNIHFEPVTRQDQNANQTRAYGNT